MERRLQTIARESGGRTYWRNDVLDVPAVYDGMMEHLRIRYLVRYRSTSRGAGWKTVRVSLIDPQTRRPLRIVDDKGTTLTAQVSVEGRYRP